MKQCLVPHAASILALLAVGLVPSAKCHAQIASNVLTRVFQARFGDSIGTVFTIEVNDRQYLITAKHVVAGVKPGNSISLLMGKDNWFDVRVTPIFPTGEAAEMDIVALAPAQQVSKTYPIKLVGDGPLLSQEVYFLGYPFGMGTFFPGWLPVPFVKRGIVAAFDNDLHGFWIDGINNPGFSGGPVVIVTPGHEYIVIGVVSGYRNAREPVYTALQRTPAPTDAFVLSNSGLVLAQWIKPILDAIKEHEIGVAVPTVTPTPNPVPSP